MEMDISQYKDLFITEAQEHLDALNRSLLNLEKDPASADVVAEIFRSAHTLKGMSATMGYDQLTQLAHEMEDLLEHLRSGDMEVTTEVVDVLFACFDTLGAIVDAIAVDRPEPVDYSGLVSDIRVTIEGRPVTADTRGEGAVATETPPDPSQTAISEQEKAAGVIEAPVEGGSAEPVEAPGEEVADERVVEEEALERGGTPPEPAGETAPALLEVPEEEVAKYSAVPGMRVLRLTVNLDRDCVLKSVRVFMVFKKLAQLGEVLASLPSVEALEEERFDRSFQVGLATAKMSERVREALLGISEVAWVSVEALYEPPVEEKEDVAAGIAGPEAEREALALARRTQSIRVNIARLDALMNLVGELVTNRTRLAEIASDFEISELREALDQTMRLTAELQDEVMKTRMVPVEHVFNRFPRMVRDLARSQGKEIDFVVEGKEIELDRTILDEISEPLIHMIRNAVDHGMEPPDERLAKGKPSEGRIRLSAYRDRNYIAVSVEDDGEGIDHCAVFDRALARDLISEEERRQLTAEEVLRVISMPGFSISEKADGVSGRGVGMDVVKYKAESLGGFVVLDTAAGLGTKVTLMLPLTLAIIQALMVDVCGEIYAIPLGTVRETQVVDPAEIKTIRNQETVFLREETVPLLRLDRSLDCPRALDGAEPFPVVITEVGPRLVAIAVHSLVGQREIVINTLDRFLKRVQGFAGATILGTGRVALILDIPSLMKPGRLAVERMNE